MDYTTCYCRLRRCSLFGKTGSSAQLKLHDWQRGGPRFRCQVCDEIVSASTGTAYAGIRTDLEIYRRGAKALAEGLSIRAIGRLVEVDKDTVNQWLPILGRQSQDVMNYFFRNLHLEECQLDELWTFIYKKEKQLTALEKLAEVYGDAWIWIAFSPVCKLVPAWVIGKRTLPHARRLVFWLKSASDGQIPFFTSDELPHYAEALLDVYGEQVQPQRKGTRTFSETIPCATVRFVLRRSCEKAGARTRSGRFHTHCLRHNPTSRGSTHPNQIHKWKKQALESFSQLFEEDRQGIRVREAEHERELNELYAEIGRLSAQLSWLKKKSGIKPE